MNKILKTSAILSLMTLSAPAFSSPAEKMVSGSLGMSACAIYCSVAGPAGFLLMSSSASTFANAADGQRKAVAQAILNDTQNFYQTGALSSNLEQFVAERKSVSELAENEIIDELNNFAVSLLDENH
jgi:hypothetical protein